MAGQANFHLIVLSVAATLGNLFSRRRFFAIGGDRTAGSNSMSDSGTAIFHAAAQVRGILLGWAAGDLGVDVAQLKAENGIVTGPDGKSRSYGDLVKGRSLHVAATSQTNLIPPDRYKVMGKNVPRLDIPPKLTGEAVFVQDIRMDNMVHARAVRPPNYGATLTRVDSAAVEKMPGVVKVIRQGNYLAFAAEGEFRRLWRCAHCSKPRSGSRQKYCRSKPTSIRCSSHCRPTVRSSTKAAAARLPISAMWWRPSTASLTSCMHRSVPPVP